MTSHTIALQKAFLIKLPNINIKLFVSVGFCLVLALSVFYVYQINSMISSNYGIKSYQKQINTLTTENKNLEVKLAQISYIENVKQKTAELGFSKVQTVKYIQILDSSLAQR